MIQFTQPLREEHQELLPHIQQMQTVADAVGVVPLASLGQGIDDTYAFLTRQLLPHAQAEERALYPVVEEVMGAPEATATMSRDHVAIGQLTAELEKLRISQDQTSLALSQAQALRRVLYGLAALVAVHFAKEEEIYLPILDAHLSETQAQRLFEMMEQAAQEAKNAVEQ